MNIAYAAFSRQGEYRSINQDNLYCPDGYLLPEKNAGMETVRSGSATPGTCAVCAVFDGMGGEQGGEAAAYLAAEKMREQFGGGFSLWDRFFPERRLKDYCSRTNQAVDEYRVRKKFQAMGTTLAAVLAAGNRVFACNLGDSRIYRACRDQLEQVSEDHVQKGTLFKNAPLMQYLGVPAEEMVLEPSIRSFPYTGKDRYLLCTDGVWNCCSDRQLEEILLAPGSLTEAAGALLTLVGKADSRDNATAVLLELR